MKISTRGTYAIEVVMDLAMYSDERHLESLKNIAERRNFSEKYIERIVKSLKQGGIIRGIRGAQGGYCLTKQAKDISVMEVLHVVEGELTPVACLTAETECGIDQNTCPTREIWSDIWKEILDVTDSVTIEDLVSYSKNL